MLVWVRVNPSFRNLKRTLESWLSASWVVLLLG